MDEGKHALIHLICQLPQAIFLAFATSNLIILPRDPYGQNRQSKPPPPLIFLVFINSLFSFHLA
jgi:hypothetical protein